MSVRMKCLACGCTDDRACPGGCSWAAPSVCSRCAPLIDLVLVTLRVAFPSKRPTAGTLAFIYSDRRMRRALRKAVSAMNPVDDYATTTSTVRRQRSRGER